MARNHETPAATKASASGTVRALALTAVATLLFAGCLDAERPDSSATLQELQGNDPVGDPIHARAEPGRTVFTWADDLEGDACVYASGQGCSTGAAQRLDDKPENHQKWYEVTVGQALDGAEMELSWSVESGDNPRLRFVLQCQEPGAKPCHGDDSNVAEASGEVSPLTLEIDDLSWFGGADRMWILVGVVPQSTPAGDYYPAVDVEFEANAVFLHA